MERRSGEKVRRSQREKGKKKCLCERDMLPGACTIKLFTVVIYGFS
jgi:hypothetical protein